jgi:hypothetical protein
VDGVSGVPDLEPMLARYIEVLHTRGIEEVPPTFRERVCDAEWARICDERFGFAYWWLHYAWMYVKGRGPGKGWQRACPGGEPRVSDSGRTWAWQFQVALQVTLYDLLLILKPRQIGASYFFANFAIWASLSAPEQRVAICANKMQTSENDVRRARLAYRRLPEWIRERVSVSNPAVTHFEFSNGSVIECYSGDPNSARSEGASWVLVDEIGEIEHLHEWFAATSPAAEEGGHMVMFGTGKDNGLEEWVLDCVAGPQTATLHLSDYSDGVEMPVHEGINGMHFFFLPYYVHPERDEAWYEQKQRTFKGSLDRLRREFPAVWQDAFAGASGCVFDTDALKAQALLLREVPIDRDRRGSLVWDGTPTSVRFVDDPRGAVTIHADAAEFGALLASKRPFVIFADTAGERASGDYHAASALQVGCVPYDERDHIELDDIVPHRQLVTIHGYMDADIYATLLVKMGYLLGNALLAVEENGVGQSVIVQARRLKYPAMYWRRTTPIGKTDKATQRMGWWTDIQSKQNMYGECERLLRNGWLEVRDGATLAEMSDVMNLGMGRIGAKDPKTDDLADSIAGCCAIARNAKRWGGTVAPSSKPPAFSIAVLYEELDRRTRDSEYIGNEMGSFMVRR